MEWEGIAWGDGRRGASPSRAKRSTKRKRSAAAARAVPPSKKRPMSPLIEHKPPARLHLGRRESAATAEALLRAVVS
jgi:hypothetical protein